MSFTFLHAADLHLGSPFTGLALRDETMARRFAKASRKRSHLDMAWISQLVSCHTAEMRWECQIRQSFLLLGRAVLLGHVTAALRSQFSASKSYPRRQRRSGPSSPSIWSWAPWAPCSQSSRGGG